MNSIGGVSGIGAPLPPNRIGDDGSFACGKERITKGDLDDDNGNFEGAGPDGTDIEVGTDWAKNNTSVEIDDEAGSGVNTFNGSTFCCKIHTATDDNPSIQMYGANVDAAFANNEWYEISYDYKTQNCTNARVYVFDNTGTRAYKALTSEVWASNSFIFQIIDNSNIYITLRSHSGTDEDGTEILWIDNISIKNMTLIVRRYGGSLIGAIGMQQIELWEKWNTN